MEFFRIKKDIPFMRHALIFNVISALTFAAAVFFLFSQGLHLSIEFTGGTVMEVAYTKPADIEGMRKAIGGLGYTDSQVQSFGTAQDVLIRLPAQKGGNAAQMSTRVTEVLKAQDASLTVKRVEFVGPQVGEELARDGLTALDLHRAAEAPAAELHRARAVALQAAVDDRVARLYRGAGL